MKWACKALLFVAREAARPALEAFGTKVGEALGHKLGKKIDPTAFEAKEGEDDDEESD